MEKMQKLQQMEEMPINMLEINGAILVVTRKIKVRSGIGQELTDGKDMDMEMDMTKANQVATIMAFHGETRADGMESIETKKLMPLLMLTVLQKTQEI
jgi:hypothetical protein